MGMCKPSGGISSQVGRVGSLKTIETPNTRTDLYDENGNLLQQRWYGPDGRAIWDRDWDHSNPHHNHTFPHDHFWDWSKPPFRFYYKGPNNENTNISFC